MSRGSELLGSLSAPPQKVPARPKPDSPGFVVWDGESGTACTRTMTEQPADWDAILRELGVDPEHVQVVGHPEVRSWDVPGAGRQFYYKAKLAQKNGGADVAELVSSIARRRPRKPAAAVSGGGTFVVGMGDLQLGKIDGDGIQGTVDRTLDAVDATAARLRAVRKIVPISELHIALLGDACEGFVSQGGANAWRTRLTMTEQTALLRQIIDYTIDTLAPLAESVNVAAVPGNHDQAVRLGGKGVTRYDDSFDVDSVRAVAMGWAKNPARYGHVRTVLPAQDEISVTVPLAGGLTIAHAHGNHHRAGKHWEWWQGHGFSDHPAGRADLLHEAHGHHLHIEQRSGRTYLMNPAMESESTWWRHRTGQTGQPGLLTYTVAGGRLGNLEVV